VSEPRPVEELLNDLVVGPDPVYWNGYRDGKAVGATEARRELLDDIERMRWTHRAVEPDHACEYDIALRDVQRLIEAPSEKGARG